MAAQLLVLGVNPLSLALLLALRGRERLQARLYAPTEADLPTARALGLADALTGNLSADLPQAALVVLAQPLIEQQAFLSHSADLLRPDAVLVSLTPVFAPVLSWANALPPNLYMVAARPVLNPALLGQPPTPRADLFSGGLWALAGNPTCPPEALKAAADLATLCGAQPFYTDVAEHDGLSALNLGMPGVLALALWRVAHASGGWEDARKLADTPWAALTAPLTHLSAEALTLNAPATLTHLDAVLAELHHLRAALAAQDRLTVHQHLTEAASQRADWEARRAHNDWEPANTLPQAPSAAASLRQLLFGNLFGKKTD